ncbi:MAG: hypothetical protein ACJ76H_08030 [Bacteriovoracaceae bacterium]
MLIKIRFNTDTLKIADSGLPEWRVIIDNVEYLARNVRIEVPTWTTVDEVSPGLMKWHMTTEGIPVWSEDRMSVTIK